LAPLGTFGNQATLAPIETQATQCLPRAPRGNPQEAALLVLPWEMLASEAAKSETADVGR
jgi:hypothetical protein